MRDLFFGRKWNIIILCGALLAGLFLPVRPLCAKTLLGTPRQEILLQLAEECLEEYNFTGIHMYAAAGRRGGSEGERPEEEQSQLEEWQPQSLDGQDQVQTEVAGQGDLFVPQQYIMVGDSRFTGMEQAVGGAGCVWISQVSAGLSWFRDTALPLIDEAVADGSVIIINMGVNDLGNVEGYKAVLEEKVPQWMDRGAVVYYMSVNPVRDHAYITNGDIINFNNTLFNEMPLEVGWIETNTYLLVNGYGAPDGIHYDDATYQTIFNYCMQVISGFGAG